MAAGDIDWDIVAEGIVAKVGVVPWEQPDRGRYKRGFTRGTRHLRGLAAESPRGLSLQREAIGGLRSHLY